MPLAKKLMVDKAARRLQVCGKSASKRTSTGMRIMLRGRARPDRAACSVDQRGDVRPAPDCRVAIRLQQRRGLQRVGLQSGAGCRMRDERQKHSRHHGDEREHTHHLKQGEAVFLSSRRLHFWRWSDCRSKCPPQSRCRLPGRPFEDTNPAQDAIIFDVIELPTVQSGGEGQRIRKSFGEWVPAAASAGC